MEITYTNHEGFYLPNLTLPRKEEASFGRYGRLRLKYLKEHRKVLYINLLTSGELTVVSRVMRKFALVSGRNLLQGGGLTAPWLHYSRQGAKGQGRRYAARLALDALRTGCYHPA